MDPSGKREESKAMASDREEQRRNYTFSVPLKRLSDVPNDTPDPSKSIDARECAARFCEETLGISANEVNLQAVLQSLPLSHRSHTVAYKAKGAMANQVSVAIPTPGARAPHAGELSAAPPPDESTLAQSVFLHRQGGLEPSASTSNDTAVATGCADAPCEMKSLWSIANGFDQDIRLREVILRHVWPFKHREKDRERTGLHYLPTQPTRVAFLVKFNQKSNETNDDMDAMLAQERYKPFSIDFNGVRNLQEQLKRSIERSENELVGTGGNRWRRDEVALAARELVSDDVVQLVMYVAILMHDVHVRCTRTDAEESLKHALEMFQGIRQRLEKKQPLRLRNAAMYLALPLVLVSCRLAVDRYFLCRLQLFTSTRQGQQAHMEAMDNIDELLDPDGYLSKVSFVQASSAALAIMHRKQKHQTGEQSYTKPTSQRINSVTKAATYTLGHAPGSARARKQFWKNVQRHPHG